MNTSSLLQGLRVIDSFFPSGGFGFSSGLEAAVQGGMVRTSLDLNRYVIQYLEGGIGTCEAIALARVHEATTHHRLQPIVNTDLELDAMKLCKDTREASCQMGRSILRMGLDHHEPTSFPGRVQEAIISGQCPGHLVTVLGVTLGSAGWTRSESIAAFLYQTVVGFVSSSLKLLPIGQHEGQRLLASWSPLMTTISHQVTPEMAMTSWTPLHDIFAMRHARLSSRLFRS